MKVALACDHAGVALRESVELAIRAAGHEIEDLGVTRADVPVDYPDYAAPAARAVAEGRVDRAVLLCATGIGMSMAANKVPGVRAALCTSVNDAELSRRHNDANVLCLGGRTCEPAKAGEIVSVWLRSPFDGGRHVRRIKKITQLECLPPSLAKERAAAKAESRKDG